LSWGQTRDKLVGDSGHNFGNWGTGLHGIGGSCEVVHKMLNLKYSSIRKLFGLQICLLNNSLGEKNGQSGFGKNLFFVFISKNKCS
jgi:hypothetical protein